MTDTDQQHGEQVSVTQQLSSEAAHPDVRTVRLKLPDEATSSSLDESTVFRPASASLETQYEILEKIGGGGMGSVYLAKDRRLGRYVAAKRINDESLNNESLRERFLREAQAIAALNHIHIVHLYALGDDQQGPYIVMEYVPGPRQPRGQDGPAAPFSLADRVHREGILPLDEALELILKVAGAIEYAHRNDIIHRDLKPSNVLLDASEEPKVVDFGLARMTDVSVKPLTMPGEKMLSLGYGAPEQETDASLTDGRVDVYGLGALLYFCITGKNPRYFRPNDVPEVLRMSIVKALETNRDKRWESVSAFMEALSLLQSPRASGLTTAKTTWRCKWCEASNPIMIRYCGECGWDGGAVCAECGSESRFGIQFCGVCGADAKAYESAQALLNELEDHRQNCDFSFILQKEKQIAAFNPKGMNGRRLVERVNELGQEAGAALRRRVALASAIDREMAAGNFEHVRDYINEYNEISQDRAYEDVEKTLDDRIFERDVKRLGSLVESGEWRYAMDAAERLAARPQGKDHADVKRLREHARRHLRGRYVVRLAMAVFVAMMLYAFSAAPVYRAMGRSGGPAFRAVYGFAIGMHQGSMLSGVLKGYARLWGAEGMLSTSAP